MAYWLRRRAHDERGFTLIELLVVILIIGVLAAIVIPSFLNQTGKAVDASAKELAHSMQVAAATIGTDNNGSYATVAPAALNAVESSIQTASGNGNAWASAASGTANSYIVTASATNGDTFTISRSGSGTFSRYCTTQTGNTPTGCLAPADGTTTAAW